MKTITKLVSILLILSMIITLGSCGKKDDSNLDFSTSAGFLRFYINPIDEETDINEDAKEAAQVFENAIQFLSSDYGILSEINSDVNVVLDCDSETLSIYRGICEKLQKLGYDNSRITIGDNMIEKESVEDRLNFDIIKTGYALEKAVEFLSGKGYSNGYISLGTDCAVIGPKEDRNAYNIGIPKGEDEKGNPLYYGYISITDGYISIRDGIESVNKIIVYSADAVVNYAIAEKVSGMTFEEMNNLYKESALRFELVVITSEGKIEMTQGLKDTSIFTEETTMEQESGDSK